MINMFNHHIKMIRAYVIGASEKKRAGLFKECKLDLEKAKSEIKAMEKSIIEMDSTWGEAIMSLLPKIAISALAFVITQGLSYIIKQDDKQIGTIAQVVSGAVTTGATAIAAIKVIKDYRKQIKRGSDAKNALNQYKNFILNACEKTLKFIDKEIKYVDVITQSDERYNK